MACKCKGSCGKGKGGKGKGGKGKGGGKGKKRGY